LFPEWFIRHEAMRVFVGLVRSTLPQQAQFFAIARSSKEDDT